MKSKRLAPMSRLPLAMAVAFSLYGPVAFAQSEPAAAPKAEEKKDEKANEPKQLETVKVTGSLISRLGFDSVSPVQVITADTSAEAGQLDTAAILQTTNVSAGSTQISNQFSGFVVEGGNGVQTLSLRGLGANRTLVLLDGRRPGPAGTRGQVGAFDLNVIPSSILQRVEILKDGAGSIYGSDAVAGVVNMITRKSVDGLELTFDTNTPLEGGGERYNFSGATGWNFDSGNVVAAFQVFKMEPLLVGDREFFRCNDDLVRRADGSFVPFEDRSITRGTENEGCINFGVHNVIDVGATRHVPSPDGIFSGPFAGLGFRPGLALNGNPRTGAPAFYETPFYLAMNEKAHIFSEQERTSLFLSADFNFGDIDWKGQYLYTSRETHSERFRQFFPTISGAPYGVAGNIRPIMPFRSNQNIKVDYFYLSSSFSGGFADTSWSWNFDTTFSRSNGDYSSLGINRDLTGDLVTSPDRNGGGPAINYIDPRILSGQDIDRLQAAIGQWHTGNTIYDQFVVNAVATGDLFELPAGRAAGAFGVEFRNISIDDTPSDLEAGGGLWGQSSAVPTRGEDNIYEVFGEIEVPLIADVPGIEQFTINASARAFKYETVEDSDSVWKYGFRWQFIPSLSLRGTRGTSYRAPGLYELYLGNLSSFAAQVGNDPCINWGISGNANLQANCAAAGVPNNYTAAGTSSITVIAGGGAGILKPETSIAETVGLVWSPQFANLSASLDYFEIEVNDQVAQLGVSNIIAGCYFAPVFPNAFCDLLVRNPASAPVPYMITSVQNSYLNINQQRNRGYDLNVNWDGEFGFGKLSIGAQATYTLENVFQLFSPRVPSGFTSNDNVGTISNPKLVGNVTTALNKGDWTFSWRMDYVDDTVSRFIGPTGAFRCTPVTSPAPTTPCPTDNSFDVIADSALYHTLSVRYGADDWNVLLGVNNVADKDPPNISNGADTRYGTIPAFATQYDWYGRSVFLRLNYKF